MEDKKDQENTDKKIEDDTPLELKEVPNEELNQIITPGDTTEKKEETETKESTEHQRPARVPSPKYLIDDREITQEIIDTMNKDIYKKYKEGDKLIKLKIKTEEYSLENKILINVADLIGIKSIKFQEITTSNFNTLLSEKSLLVKKFRKILKEKELKLKQKKEENSETKEENKIEEEEGIIEPPLEEIYFNNCQIDVNFGNFFPLIKKFYLLNSKIPFDISTFLKFNYLTHLRLENIGLIENNFKDIIMQISKNEQMKHNLKLFSVKNNNIGLVDPCSNLDNDKIPAKIGLNNLEVFDLSNNKIFLISVKMLNALTSIKVIDLTNNGIIFPPVYNSYISACKKNPFLFLATNNYALLNDKNKEIYINYLIDIFPKLDYPYTSISLINLYVGKFYEKMKSLNLSKFSNSLLELDLSFGYINDNDMINLFKGNLALYNLKKLNLSKNKLTEKLLDLMFENNFNEKFTQLKILNLSGNKLGFTKAENYQKFFEKFIKLKKFIAHNTPFELSLNNYTRTKINRYYENERYKTYKTNFSNEDLEIQKIVENDNYLLNKTNVTIEVIDINNYKYISKIKKFYPEILKRVNFETRFYESK